MRIKNLYNRIRQWKIVGQWPKKSEINSVLFSFSKKERTIFIGLATALLLSTVLILENINQSFMVSRPMRGGKISEGIIGAPRFINPILASSPADQDLVSLIYSGLMRKNSDGALMPDLAEKYEMSKNGLIYTFILKNNLYFQDGKPLTADDVLFTINKAEDSIIKSPQKVNWDGVNVEKIDEKTIRFTLKQPYVSFLENTILGIMPAHLWDGSPMELNEANTNPIGSGPYMIQNVSKQSSGIIDYYELAPFKKFALGEAYISNINLYFYSNEDDLIKALENGTVDQISSITPLNAENLKEKNYQIESSVLPRIFGLFFNQNVNRLFTDKVITGAIDQAIDKNKIIEEVLSGYGAVIDGPIPFNLAQQTLAVDISREEILQKIQNNLTKNGWTKDADGFLEKITKEKNKKTTAKLEFSISTGNAPELAETAELIKQDLQAIRF